MGGYIFKSLLPGPYAVHVEACGFKSFESKRWSNTDMRDIAISKFKATCLAVLEDVRRTGAPVTVTRFGKPVAEIVPPRSRRTTSWLGCMKDSMKRRAIL